MDSEKDIEYELENIKDDIKYLSLAMKSLQEEKDRLETKMIEARIASDRLTERLRKYRAMYPDKCELTREK